MSFALNQLHWRWIVSPLLLCLLAAIEHWIAPFSLKLFAWPFLISLLFFGMPHGAADLERFAGAIAAPSLRRALPRFMPYIGFVLLSVVGIVLAPQAGLVAFAFLSAWHFGREDRHGALHRKARGIARGLFILSVPIALHPAAVSRLINDWLTLLHQPAPGRSSWSTICFTAEFIALLSLTTAGLLALVVFLRGEKATALREVVELAALGVAFAVLDPIFAVGAYFLMWHSLRQMEFPASSWLAGLTGIRRGALPLLLPTLALYAGVSWWQIGGWNPALQVALLLIFFAAVTPAHELLALWLRTGLDEADGGNTYNAGRPKLPREVAGQGAACRILKGSEPQRCRKESGRRSFGRGPAHCRPRRSGLGSA